MHNATDVSMLNFATVHATEFDMHADLENLHGIPLTKDSRLQLPKWFLTIAWGSKFDGAVLCFSDC